MTHHPVDVHVGQKIRHRRWLVEMTQKQLAAATGVKFQQIQKYENGANRVSASRLWEIAGVLGVPVAHFFEGLDGQTGEAVAIGRIGLRIGAKAERLSPEVARNIEALMDAQLATDQATEIAA